MGTGLIRYDAPAINYKSWTELMQTLTSQTHHYHSRCSRRAITTSMLLHHMANRQPMHSLPNRPPPRSDPQWQTRPVSELKERLGHVLC